MSVEKGIESAVENYTADGDTRAFKIKACLSFGPGFPAFEGHFPGNPILPGIIQLASVRILAARFLGCSLAAQALFNIKFRDMIRPEQTVNLNLSGREKNGGWKVHFEIMDNDTPVASGDVLLMPVNASDGG